MIPYVLDDATTKYVDGLCEAATEPLNLARLHRSDSILCALACRVASLVVAREGLPHIAHLICGWGNAVVEGRPLVDILSDYFIGREEPYIPQSCPSGDFHPWQTFAYCRMAGIDCQQNVAGVPLARVIRASNDLVTSDYTDLGHFLYAFAGLPTEWQPRVIKFDRQEVSIDAVFNAAIDGHIYGGYHVCRKFHLTEGLCATATRLGISNYLEVIGDLLAGQLNSLRPLLGSVPR